MAKSPDDTKPCSTTSSRKRAADEKLATRQPVIQFLPLIPLQWSAAYSNPRRFLLDYRATMPPKAADEALDTLIAASESHGCPADPARCIGVTTPRGRIGAELRGGCGRTGVGGHLVGRFCAEPSPRCPAVAGGCRRLADNPPRWSGVPRWPSRSFAGTIPTVPRLAADFVCSRHCSC
jgi:hypothetical protein